MEQEKKREMMVEDKILETIKACEQRQEGPLVMGMEVAKCLVSLGISVPSPELGQVLVSYLCFQNNHPSLWKFLQQSLSSRLVSSLHVLSLLSSRVIPNRRSQPEAYRLYLELLSRFLFSADTIGDDARKEKIIKSVDVALKLSQTYGVQILDLGHVLVLFFFSIVVGLIDSTFNDWGLLLKSPNVQCGPFGNDDNQDMDVDARGNFNMGRHEHREVLRKTNPIFAIEVLLKLTESRKAMVLLRVVHSNMPDIFNGLLQRLLFCKANELASSNMESANQLLERLFANIQRVYNFEYQLNQQQIIQMLIDTKPCKPMAYCNLESEKSASWVSFDIYMENIMDGKQLHIRSSIAILRETIKTLQVLNRASWQETFLALWLSALRLVQRERDPVEGPIPHLESRLCILLTIVPLAIANILEDETKSCSSALQGAGTSGHMETRFQCQVEGNGQISRKHGLISALQVLGDFSGLLCPPASVVGAANAAAIKAASFISNSKNAKSGLGGGNHIDASVNAGGNMRHLIVEACIARNLIDASAYFWPGYVPAAAISMSDLPPLQKSPWLTFMEGSALNNSLVNSLLTTPATSLAEIEKLYHIALNGSAEQSAAAKILCGASLTRGWNIQEHVVHYLVKLLSPPVPSTHSGLRSHLVDYAPMLSAILFGASSIDNVHILSLHGVIPEFAASLMPICETFGSLMPTSTNVSSTCDEPSFYMVFSAAFLFLLRLWKFYRPSVEQWLTGGGTLGSEITLEYLLMLRNRRIASKNSAALGEINSVNSDSVQIESISDKPVYVDFYPKLRAWYCQNKSCVASTLSGLSTGNPVHQVANKILNMIYSKMTRIGTSPGNSSTLSSNSLCGSSSSSGEDPYQRPMLPAWEVLEAVPFVLEAILTACAHGRLSSRDLTTGLRDLIDFLPASLGGIISYFAAEVTRGTWKPVPMNGTDWPSPAAVLSSVESEMREILSAAGVDFPTFSSRHLPVMLPLPMAALVSLTITFKLNKGLDYLHVVVGPALENCASGCPWPSVPIIGSLWAQKVRRWHDYIVVSCARSVFRQNKEAVSKLLRSCFSSFLGSVNVSSPLLTNQCSIGGLLGNTIPSACGSLAPGFLYLRSCRTIQDIQYVNGVIIGLVGEHARESAARWANTSSSRLKSSQASLNLAAAKAREAATLGASLLCISGGMNLVQELYLETIPTWLLSSKAVKHGEMSVVSRIVEGYAMAYMLVLSGSLVWGAGSKSPSWALSRRAHIVGSHMDFLAGVLEGHISLGCHPATWKAYFSCLVRLLASFAPAWIQEVRLETMKKLANGLRGWYETELAISLLERGGVAAIGLVAELVNVLD
ncbi:mediator of RNA polymerase II transcription subunit 33A [Ricinus communis]|uniref:mediator of RNA polymerase II transcription subunit 33A n=1 Tax=Ricinus communis TaxID=3988 RepID=UPI00201AECBE|nr:mediator of RNA polymerase II transcription subunit 33A [Ricinus communis]